MESIAKKEVRNFSRSKWTLVEDSVIVEEPLELYADASSEAFLVTMRTPGDDQNLILGLLFSLEIIQSSEDVRNITIPSESQARVLFKKESQLIANRFTTNSSCGLCNGNSWDTISSHSYFPVFDKTFRKSPHFILDACNQLQKEGDYFSSTGGNHKVILVSIETHEIIASAEDVGRHNAFDKVIGHCLSEKLLPLNNYVAVLSGRCSYEMCLKAWQAGIPVIISKGAPTSKSIELADAAGITLIGFTRTESFNVYTHSYRIENEEG